jgi:hypothetical protein
LSLGDAASRGNNVGRGAGSGHGGWLRRGSAHSPLRPLRRRHPRTCRPTGRPRCKCRASGLPRSPEQLTLGNKAWLQ